MAEQHDTGTGHRGPAPQTVTEALERASLHGRAAAAESLAMLRALLDAAALASGGTPAESSGIFGPPGRLIDDLAAQLGGEVPLPSSVLSAIAEALDVEIARWEQRASEDADARAVLRAFLGLREVLWEFGVRAGGKAGEANPTPPAGARARRTGARPRRRVQRVRVEG